MLNRALRRLAPAVAAGALVGALAAGWSGLWFEPPTGRLALAAAAGTVPAFIRMLGLRRSALWATLAAAGAAVVALGAAVGADPWQVLSGDSVTWTRLGEVLPDGLGNAASTSLPLGADDTQYSAFLILVLSFASALIAWQTIVARRPLSAIVATAAPLAYRWTLVPPDRPVLTGVATLVVALAALRLAAPPGPQRGPEGRGRAVTVGVVVTVVALLGSIGADRTPVAWWGWETWTFGTGQGRQSLDLEQRYGPLIYPDDPVVVMRVAADQAVPLRAVALENFDGTSFTLARSRSISLRANGPVTLRADRDGKPERLKQQISLTGTRTPWLLAGGRPVTVRGLGSRTLSVATDGSVHLDPAAGPEMTYSVDTLIPDPGPRALLASTGYREGVEPDLLRIAPGGGLAAVDVPAWGTGARLDPDAFGQYAGLYRLAIRTVGDAGTPYEAVNRVEAFLRGGRFDYDELAARAVGTPELVNFALVTRRGYCQHFAGTMALMLRMSGIPTRVAVGFTTDPGRYDPEKDTYEILDRDAHSWVEVFFEGSGWLPFDPTPGRGVPNSASVSSSRYSVGGLDIAGTAGISEEAVRPVAPAPRRREPAFPTDGGGGDGSTDAGAWLVVLAAIAGALLVVPLAIKAVRRLRRRRGDERARVLGAARELESLMLDAGLELEPSLAPTERARAVWRHLGIDADRIYGLASAARFAQEPPPPGAGREAWAEFARARRRLGWARRLRAGVRLRSLRRAERSSLR